MGVLKHPPLHPLVYFGLGSIETFSDQKLDKKNWDKLTKIFLNYVESPCIFQYSHFPLYIFLTRKIDTFWSAGISSTWGNSTFYVQNSKRFFELYQVFMRQTIIIFSIILCMKTWFSSKNLCKFLNYIKSSCIIFCAKMSRYFHVVYYWRTPEALLRKNWFYFFFSSSAIQKFNHLLGWHATSINSLFISFLNVLLFSNSICQAKSLIWIIVSGSSSSWLLSPRLILLRFSLRVPKWLQQNVALPKY